jgi:superfamily II DNA/RNA helicase
MPRSPKLTFASAPKLVTDEEIALPESELVTPEDRKDVKRKRKDQQAAVAECELIGEDAVKTKKKRREHKEPDIEKASSDSTGDAEKPKKKKKQTDVLDGATPLAVDSSANEGLLSADDFRKKFQISAPRDGQVLPEPVQEFEQAPFSKKVRSALVAAGFAAPSAIQAQGWPVAVTGADLVAVAQTGSGKTLGYLLPAFRALKAMEEDSTSQVAKPLALVLAPTRELAMQIEAECTKFGKFAKVSSQAVFGGVPKGPQAKALKENPALLVATPGRLQDLMEMGALSLERVAYLVLDEADRMLDMGFEPEIAKVLAATPADRQTLLFTATWPKSVKKIAANYLKEDYIHVNVGETEELAANTAVAQEFFQADDDEKETKLWRILDGMSDNAKVIVFGNTKRRAEGLCKSFKARGYEAVALHGDKPQWERERDLKEFAAGRCWLLFATDVCARGLDIKDITHVVNYDMARDVESYVHRIGRTGRAGCKGASITFWNPAYDMECSPALAKIAKEAGQVVPDFLEKAACKQKEAKNKAWRY